MPKVLVQSPSEIFSVSQQTKYCVKFPFDKFRLVFFNLFAFEHDFYVFWLLPHSLSREFLHYVVFFVDHQLRPDFELSSLDLLLIEQSNCRGFLLRVYSS